MESQCKRRREQVSAPAEDLLTSLHDDLLISILSFFPIKQRVALSAVCSRFRRLLLSIPRLDAFRLDVVQPSGGVDISQQFTFPRALIRQCHIVFHEVTELPKPLRQLLVGELIEVGVEDLILETSGYRIWFNLSWESCSFFGIKSLRSLSLRRVKVVLGFCNRLVPSTVAFTTFFTSLKMDQCIILLDMYDGSFNFLCAFLASSCPFLETLHFIDCDDFNVRNLTIHSTSIKHLVLLHIAPNFHTIDVRCPKLESLTVDVVACLCIEAPKVQHASLLLRLYPPVDPPNALMKLFKTAFRSVGVSLMLNSSTTPNGLATENEIYRIVSPEHKDHVVIFNLDFNLKDQSSTMIFSQFLKNCRYNHDQFDIRVGAAHIQSTNETTTRDDDQLLHHGSTDPVELIKLRMIMPEKIFRGFLSNQKEMEEELKQMGLKKLKSRTGRDQFDDVLASDESLVKVSSSIANCIEMKF
ncbi:uncharacterized protein LOC141816562 [Curcuma longa]|uniref:uncharacterized protein LOC141816562 n=1 Tax=Curcuma longa TaxID=136217 RepID=UPI003D9F9CEF